MCGIVGFTGTPNPNVLRAMAASIQHRGPDDAGFFESPYISLGMQRLAIVDPETGQQPVSNEDQTLWLVFNGEIYNHHSLRRALIAKGHLFRSSHADTETVVHAFEEYGLAWPTRGEVNGMFGLALWEAPAQRLLLYRDRLGKKPLYYAQAGQELIFGSEINGNRDRQILLATSYSDMFTAQFNQATNDSLSSK